MSRYYYRTAGRRRFDTTAIKKELHLAQFMVMTIRQSIALDPEDETLIDRAAKAEHRLKLAQQKATNAGLPI